MKRWLLPSILVLVGSASGLNYFAAKARGTAPPKPAAAASAPDAAPASAPVMREGKIVPTYDKIIPATDAPFLQVVLAAPEGALATESQASEIRWMFDRPVVELSAIGQRENIAQFVKIDPPLEGKFQWASTRMLIFTAKNVRRSTAYKVTLDGLKALDGKPMEKPFVLNFETPRVKCWFQRTHDGWQEAARDAQFAVSCDQPVDGPDVGAHVRVVMHSLQLDVAPYTPAPADLEKLRKADPAAAKLLTDTLERLARPTAAGPEIPVRYIRTGFCPQSTTICHFVAVPGLLQLDAAAQIRFVDGIRSMEGPLTSLNVPDYRLETPKTPLVRTSICQPRPERCNPEEGYALDDRGIRGSDRAAYVGRVTVRDLTDPARPAVVYRLPKFVPRTGNDAISGADVEYEMRVQAEARWDWPSNLEWAGMLAGHDYEIELAPELTAFPGRLTGQRLILTTRVGNMPAYARLRGGERVLERGFAAGVRVRLRNVTALERVRARIEKPGLIELIRRYNRRDNWRDGSGIRYADYRPETIKPGGQLNLPRHLTLGLSDLPGFKGSGIFLLAARPTAYEPHSRYDGNADGEEDPTVDMEADAGWSTSLVQLTDLAVTIKQSPRNILVSVTSLRSGKPAAGARVELHQLNTQGSLPFWKGTVDADGLAWAPAGPVSGCRHCGIVAIAEQGDDLAYTQSRWREENYDYYYYGEDGEGGDYVSSEGADRELARVFTDRGVYKPGEEVRFKGMIRLQQARALAMPAPRELTVTVSDPRDATLVTQKIPLGENGAFEGAFTLPAEAVMGTWSVSAGPGHAYFLMTSYRRPEFKVDAGVDRADYISGETLSGTVRGNYLFGAAMENRAVTWNMRADRASFDPTENHPELGLSGYSWSFWCHWNEECWRYGPDYEFGNGSGALDGEGLIRPRRDLPVRKVRHYPYRVTLEGTVTDVNRQEIAARAAALVHPGDYYAGIKVTNRFGAAAQAVRGVVAAVAPDGQWKPGAKLSANLVRWEWSAAARLTGDESALRVGGWRRVEIAKQEIVSEARPMPFSFTPELPGYYEVNVTSTDSRGNWIESGTDVYVLGDGFVAWRDNGDDSLRLLPERESYAPGETAKVLIQSPWTEAEGLVTVEREEVITARRFAVKGGASVVEVPILSDQTPNVYVSVTLFKGRTAKPAAGLPDDPGRPQVKSGTVELRVPPAEKRLSVAVKADAEEYKPGMNATASVTVTGADGKPAQSEVTLWAVDEGVLRLTGYALPDLISAFYPERSHLVVTADGRMKLIPVTPDEEKGGAPAGNPSLMEDAAPGGGGGTDENGAKIRSDFRVLAVWQGVVPTDAQGRASVSFKLPESLTSYRIMAVATSGTDRFGGGQASVRIKKPFMVLPAVPRFLNLDDRVEAGAVLHNQSGKPGNATLKLKLPENSPLALEGPAERTLALPPGPTEVRFTLRARSTGSAAFTLSGLFTAKGSRETDAVQATIPVTITRRMETVTGAGQVDGGKIETERLRLPAEIYPTLGGLDLQLSSSALAGLQNGIDFLVEYPYGCLEQRSSRVRVLMMLEQLAADYPLPSLKGKKLRDAVRAEIARFPNYQTPDGGLAYWEKGDMPDEFLTARVLILMLDAESAGYPLPPGLKDGVVGYLQQRLGLARGRGEWDPQPGYRERDGAAETWRWNFSPFWFNRAHILYALARAGHPEPALNEFLWERRAGLPILEQIHLLHAMALSGQTGEKPARLYREMLNYLRIESDRAFVQNDLQYDNRWCPCLNYLFAGDTHNTAALLSLMLKVNPKEPLAARLARALLAQRKDGVWLNTLEDGYALTALVDYARAQEAAPPDFLGEITLGAQTLFSQRFSGRELTVRGASVPMGGLVDALDPEQAVPLSFSARGTGRLYYSARLKYAPLLRTLPALDAGFTVQRDYFVYGDERGSRTEFKAGDLVTVRLRVTTAQVRHQVVIDDALPAGLEPLNAALQTTSQANLRSGRAYGQPDDGRDGDSPGWRTGIDHVELRDERVLLFATTLTPGTTVYQYVARATAPGQFIAPPAQAEEMYRPEIFGRSAYALVTVTPPAGGP